MSYMAHYSPDAKGVVGRKVMALKQTQARFDQLMNDFIIALSDISKKYPRQSNDFAVSEAIRHINKASNLFGTVGLATESSLQGITNLYDSLANNLDSMSEMSEMTSLRLQMTMDRRSKFISTLSQMMKKISTTQDMLVQNLK